MLATAQIHQEFDEHHWLWQEKNKEAKYIAL